jgi:hypothetical protein
MSRKISIGQGLFAIVDDEDFDWLNKYKWYVRRETNSTNIYAQRNAPKGENPTKPNTMHGLIMGSIPGKKIDHRNRDGLDNRRSNLRHCTHQENLYNTGSSKDSSSKYKGVSLHKCRKWQASINIKGKLTYLGLFVAEVEAARAYNKAALKHHGEFAYQNILETGGTV